MDEVNKESFRKSLPFFVIFFLIAFNGNWVESTFTDGLLNGIIGSLIFGTASFLIIRSIIKNKITFEWWQWIFYFIGWFLCFFNLSFWLIVGVVYIFRNRSAKPFGRIFHEVVYSWGIVLTSLFLISEIIIFLL